MTNEKLMMFSSYLKIGKNEEIKSYDSCLSELGIKIGTLRYEYVKSYFYENPLLAVDFEEEIKDIAKKIGFSLDKNKPYHIPVLGYTKSGKTLFAKMITEMLKNEGINAMYVDGENLLDENDGESMLERVLDRAPDLDVVVLDNAWVVTDPIGTIGEIMNSMEHGAVVSVWKYINYINMEEEIFQALGSTLTDVRIEPLKMEHSNELFEKIWSAIGHDEEKEKLRRIFYMVFEECLGFPGVTIEIFISILNKFCMEEVSDLESFATEMLGSYNIERIKSLKLDMVRVDMLKIMLTSKDPRGTTPSIIAESIKKDSATVTYHLLKLKNEGIVEDFRYGKNIFYKVKDHYVPFLEKLIAESGGG